MADFDRFCQIVRAKDPYGHLLSVHNGGSDEDVLYDYSRPWITHTGSTSTCSKPVIAGTIETMNLDGEDNLPYVEEELRKLPAKPTIDGEPSYDGIP